MPRAWIPAEWLSDPSGPASDLDLAVLLINSLDLLDDPADRLLDLEWWQDALRQTGHEELAAEQQPSQLPDLRRLRQTLRATFECADADEAAAVLNPALLRAGAVVQLHADGLRVTSVRADRRLDARLLAALARHIAEHGLKRLGVCASDPCRCAYVDRTRAGTRRYCCTVCNDRAAARAYRRRRAAHAD